MKSTASSFYRDWRTSLGHALSFHEDADGHPPERLLQAIWSRQRLRRHALRTVDGRTVTVLHPGFWNREAGPDFQSAVIQFDHEEPVAGDVEIDLRTDGWKGHGHDRNPAFADVVLHVVWDLGRSPKTPLPTLAIDRSLDASLGELSELLDGEIPPPLTKSQVGRCQAPLAALDPQALKTLLIEAAQVRLEMRTSQLRARAQECGWEQALIEGLFRALGYKHNAWPMQRLGELAPRMREALHSYSAKYDPIHWQALLLGCSGQLPNEVKGSGNRSNEYLRQLWDIWWRERDRMAPYILPAKTWRMAGIRPANHPQRRLALASHWLASKDFFKRLENWFEESVVPSTRKEPQKFSRPAASLLRVLDPGNDPIWSRRWTLRSRMMPKPQPLIGATRVTDLAINVILPWFMVRAQSGRNRKWADAAQTLWLNWPAAEDNSVLRLARARLFGSSRKRLIQTAADQQGLLQIVRDFCDHSNAICDHCQFPRLIAEWSSNPQGSRG